MAKNTVYTADMVDPELTVKEVMEKISDIHKKLSLPPVDFESPASRKSLRMAFEAIAGGEPATDFVNIAKSDEMTLNLIAEFAPISERLCHHIQNHISLPIAEIKIHELSAMHKAPIFNDLSPIGVRELTFLMGIAAALKDLQPALRAQPTVSQLTLSNDNPVNEALTCAGRLLMKIGANPTLAESGAKLLAEALEKFEKLEAVQLKM